MAIDAGYTGQLGRPAIARDDEPHTIAVVNADGEPVRVRFAVTGDVSTLVAPVPEACRSRTAPSCDRPSYTSWGAGGRETGAGKVRC